MPLSVLLSTAAALLFLLPFCCALPAAPFTLLDDVVVVLPEYNAAVLPACGSWWP